MPPQPPPHIGPPSKPRWSPAAIVDVTPRHPEPLDLAVGAFRGVRLGERTQAVVRTLGPPVRYGDFPTPTDATADQQLPTGPGGAISLDYADLALDTRNDRVLWIVTISPWRSCATA